MVESRGSPGPEREGPLRRLGEELAEDGIVLGLDDSVMGLVLEELDHARRVPVFEGRRPIYGSFVLPSDRDLLDRTEAFDVIDLSVLDLAAARTYADGRAAYLVRQPGEPPALACFERLLQYEIELVGVQEATGALIVQRTAVFGVPRLFADGVIVSWSGRRWEARATATAMLPGLCRAAPALDVHVARHTLELAVHWLSPSQIGATIVLIDGEVPWSALDTTTATRAPALSIGNRRHFPALLAALRQHDLATVVTADGAVRKVGVGLRASVEADRTVSPRGGMRHRSAQRFSYDQPKATVVVVSEDGPVTVFREGDAVVRSHTA